jgi:hypothetical protein
MATDHRKLYFDDTFTLAKTLAIKSEDSAESINAWLVRTYGQNAVNPHQPETWKYYLNVAGEYHPTDTVMQITTLDSLTSDPIQLSFTKATLAANPDLRTFYGYGTRYYEDLVRQYPDQEQLILGILYPADLATAVAAPDGAILSYPAKLVEPQEITLIPELEAWIQRYQVRWHVKAFSISSSLYLASQHAILYLNLVPKLLNLRLRRCKTNEAHSFHIREYLASHGGLDQYLDFLTLEQALFLYRNLAYLEHHNGQRRIFHWLIDRLLSRRHIPLADYSVRHLSTFTPEYYPEYQLKKKALNTPYNTPPMDEYTLDQLLAKETKVAVWNADYTYHHRDQINRALQNSPSGTLQTKVLESSATDYTDGFPYHLSDILLTHWAYLVATGAYHATCLVTLPRGTEPAIFSVEDAYVYMVYNALKALGLPLATVPPVNLSRVFRFQTLTRADLLEVVDRDYIQDNTEADWLLASRPTVKPFTTIPRFTEFCLKLYEAELQQWRYVANVQHYYRRGLIKGMVDRLYFDQYLNLPATGQSYTEWLAARGLPDTDFTFKERMDLVKRLTEAATGYKQDPTKSLAFIQKAMIGILTQLISYTVQFLREINETPLMPLNWAAIRVGDIKGLGKDEWFVPADLEVIETHGVQDQQERVLLPNAHDVLRAGAFTASQGRLELRDFLESDLPHTQIQPLPLKPFIVKVGYGAYDPAVSNTVPIIGWEYYLALTDAQKATIKDIYQ